MHSNFNVLLVVTERTKKTPPVSKSRSELDLAGQKTWEKCGIGHLLRKFCNKITGHSWEYLFVVIERYILRKREIKELIQKRRDKEGNEDATQDEKKKNRLPNLYVRSLTNPCGGGLALKKCNTVTKLRATTGPLAWKRETTGRKTEI